MKSKTSWVVLDACKQEMRCDRCKGSEPLSIIVGREVRFACDIMKAFIKLHKDCKDEKPVLSKSIR